MCVCVCARPVMVLHQPVVPGFPDHELDGGCPISLWILGLLEFSGGAGPLLEEDMRSEVTERRHKNEVHPLFFIALVNGLQKIS